MDVYCISLRKYIIMFFAWLLLAGASVANDAVSVTEFDASFDDIRLEIENAIIEKGFVIDFNGNIAKMLENTANVASDAIPTYLHAEFWQFCSSEITRDLTQIEPMNIAYCPFVLFAYETANNPDIITIGYRPMPASTSEKTTEISYKINSLLESIIVGIGE